MLILRSNLQRIRPAYWHDNRQSFCEDDVKRKFMSRYTNNAVVETEKAEIVKMLRLFNEHGLLDPDCLLKFSHHMSLAGRINSLMKIRENIIDLAGDDLLVFGTKGSDKKIEYNLAFAVKMWLFCGKEYRGYVIYRATRHGRALPRAKRAPSVSATLTYSPTSISPPCCANLTRWEKRRRNPPRLK